MALFHSFSKYSVSRRRFLKAGAYGAAGLVLYSGAIERHWIQVTRRDIALHGLPAAFDGIRIVQLSDIHLDEYTEPFFLRHVVRRINSMNPDVVFLTGDYVSDRPFSRSFARGAAWHCANILRRLNCGQVYAVLGNHDVTVGAAEVTAALTANGIAVLGNRCLPIQRGGARIWLAGLDDPVNGFPNPDLAIPTSIRHLPGEPIVLLCHAPDYADVLLAHPAGKAVSLMLSGHTHGGQICLPLLGPLVLPDQGKKYIEGWFRLGEMQLYVNRGIGTVGLPFRFDCPPEITLLTLQISSA